MGADTSFSAAMPMYGDYVNAASAKYDVPTAIINSVIQQESSFRPGTVGTKGEIGLMQLMPNIVSAAHINPYDYASNIDAGTALLAANYKSSGNWKDALSKYNSGKPYATGSQTYANDTLAKAATLGFANDGTTTIPNADPNNTVDNFFTNAYHSLVDNFNPIAGVSDKFTAAMVWLKEHALYAVVITGAVLLVLYSTFEMV